MRQGPLPTPEELFQYDRLIPGAADRIIAMAERDQASRMNQDDLITRADIRHRDDLVASQRATARGVFNSDLLGQLLGASIAMACVGGAIYTALANVNPWIPIALVSLPVASIIKAVRSIGGSKKPT